MNAEVSNLAFGTAALPNAESPYIGLRYFEESDAGLFHGRDEHTAEILGKISRARFVAVLGSSGSGKSSLVRAGLLPELRSGMIPKAGPRWRVVEFKPGNSPLGELANALQTSLGVANASELIEEGPLGIVNAVAAAQLPEKTNVLVIADQFEEVFRFQREERERGCESEAVEQCQALVRRLLDASDQMSIPVYVLLVMRSDYLGECAQFLDLPERISGSMYLVPRLRRDQVQEVITAPVSNDIEPELVQELLGKAGGDPDQLPRLQHLLNRVWQLANGDRLGMAHYRAAGEWDGALAKHLDEVASRLAVPNTVCPRMFQQLSAVDDGNRVVRRRAPMAELEAVCGVTWISGVVAAFRAEGFIRPGNPVDITHECILRNWDKVKEWLRLETEARDFYREIRAREKRGAMLSGLDLKAAEIYFGWNRIVLQEDTLKFGQYTPAWAARYGTPTDFDSVTKFVRSSARAQDKAEVFQRLLKAGVLTLLGVVVIGLAFFAWRLRDEKQAAIVSSAKEKERAVYESGLAIKAATSAHASLLAEVNAKEALELVQKEKVLADAARKEADTQRTRADAEAAKATTALASLQQYVGSHEAARSGAPEANKGRDLAADIVPTSETGLSARDLARAYNFPANLTGNGQTIALIELGGGFRESDLTAYFGGLGLRVPHLTVVPVDGGRNQPDGANGMQTQATADIEMSGAVAPGAEIILYFAPNTNKGFLDAIVAASHGPASIISIAWGGPEASWTAESIQAMNSAFQVASTRGITVIASAGDNGASDGLKGMRAVDFPASSPWVLACGGTKVAVANGRLVSEQVWNDGGGGATGGGFSSIFPAPSWQLERISASVQSQAASGGKFVGRGIPDVVANGSANSGFRVFVDGRSIVVGGTSLATPFWGGLVALMNQALGRNVGFLNPILYQKLGSSGAFRGITQGNNSVGNVKGYTAGPGWNPVAGWGSPDGQKLIDALAGLKP